MIQIYSKDSVRIYNILHQFGLTATSSSFFQMVYAIHLALDDPKMLFYITKYLYPTVAREYKTNWKCIERNLRRITQHAWQANPDLFRKMAQYHFLRCPTVSQFIAVVIAYLSSERDRPTRS